MRSGECELSAKGSYPHGRDGGYDADVVPVRCEGGHGEGGGGGGQLEAVSCLHNRQVDDIADDDTILQVGSRRVPGDGC